jgi:glutamine amidotransferase
LTTIAVIDYGMGNRRSVQKALEHVGAHAPITSEHQELTRADGLVLPGVGAFPAAMRNLDQLGLVDLIRTAARPLLGVCLGMQLLFERSEEIEPTDGLGLIPGTVTELHTGGLRVPHIGWSEVRFERSSPLTADLPAGGCPFYHVHSYAVRPADQRDIVGACEYGERFASIVQRGAAVFGVQFHPEKSSAHGLRMLHNFVALCHAPARAAPAAA